MNYSIYTRMDVLLANVETRAVLFQHLGEELFSHPKLKLAGGLSLKNMAKLSSGQITNEILNNIEEDLRNL